MLEALRSLRIRRRITAVKVWLAHAFAGVTGVPRLRFHCPVCDRDVHRWLPLRRGIGSGRSKLEPAGRLCPHCESLERTRHFALFLEQRGLLESNPRMLHFAPERGLEKKIRTRLGPRYVTTDLAMPRVDRKEDVTAMTFESGSFDLVYCSNVLEHVPDDRAAMAELFRVLAPGGTAVIQVPIRGLETYEDPSITDPRERYEHFGQSDHVRYYGEDVRDRLAAAGFEVRPFYMLDVLHLEPGTVERMNLGARELVHECRKAP